MLRTVGIAKINQDSIFRQVYHSPGKMKQSILTAYKPKSITFCSRAAGKNAVGK